MEASQLTIYANWASIVGVPILIIGLFIAFLSLKSQRRRIKDCEAKIVEIGYIISQQNVYRSGGDQNITNVTNYNVADSPDEIGRKFAQGSSKETENE